MSSAEIFNRALLNLDRALATPVTEPRDLSGIIKDFEMVYEISWKVMKKKLREAGHETLGAKDVFTKAFQLGYLLSEVPWITMIADRAQTSELYEDEDKKMVVNRIRSKYFPAFVNLQMTLN